MCVQHDNAESAGGKVDHQNPNDFKYYVPLVHISLVLLISATCSSLWSQTRPLPSLYVFEERQSTVPCCIFLATLAGLHNHIGQLLHLKVKINSNVINHL